MRPLEPIDTRNLFAPLHAELMALLRSLTPDDWTKPTIARAWRVRDVAAHLLETQLRRLSAHRDGNRFPHFDGPLIDLINNLNATWIAVAQRFSPRVITRLIEAVGPEMAAFMESLPLHEPAPISVAWAGETESQNWLDIGREFTEWWHHQQQIRDAVGAPLQLEAKWFEPLLELSVRAIRPAAATLFEVDHYQFSFEDGRIFRGAIAAPAVTVRTDADTAWRMLYHALSREEILARVTITGDVAAAEPLLSARSVMV